MRQLPIIFIIFLTLFYVACAAQTFWYFHGTDFWSVFVRGVAVVGSCVVVAVAVDSLRKLA